MLSSAISSFLDHLIHLPRSSDGAEAQSSTRLWYAAPKPSFQRRAVEESFPIRFSPSSIMAPTSSSQSPGVTKSGIATSSTGDRVIPASVRADGSQRREIRVRPGYRPPEDVEVYKNRTAEAFRTRGKSSGVPGAEGLQENDQDDSKTGQSKNAKRREARKRAKAAGDEAEGTKLEEAGVNGNAPEPTKATTKATPDEKAHADEEKKVKRLKKKLREARELQAKKAKGEGLLQEQFDKVSRIEELVRQLDELGVEDEDPEAALLVGDVAAAKAS